MKAIASRIRRLQQRLCPDGGQEQRLWFTSVTGCELVLDLDRCAEILDECGFLPKGRFCVVNLCGIPDGLNARELENYLRTNGTQAPGFGGDQEHGRPLNPRQVDNMKQSSRAQIRAD